MEQRDPRQPRARTVYVDDRLWRAISIESERQRTTVSAFVRTACQNELEALEEAELKEDNEIRERKEELVAPV